MARQRMRPIPYEKHMEAYNDFSGGLNTVSSNDNLKDNEFPELMNVDLGDRGTVKRRNGMTVPTSYARQTTWEDVYSMKWSDIY
jgi:hypothetical protein